MVTTHEWSDVLGNDISGSGALAMASESGQELADWIRGYALDLWGEYECQGMDWDAIAADLLASS